MNTALVKPVARALGAVFLVLAALYFALASSTGRTGQTLKSSSTAGCGAKASGGGSCHGTSANSAISVTLSGPAVLPVGGTGIYTVSLSGSSGSGGGLDIAVSSGTLGSSSSLIQLLSGELTHSAPLATPYAIDFSFSAPDTGAVTMFANGKGADHTGAWNWAPNLTIRVGPPPAPLLASPPDSAIGASTTPALSWHPSSGGRWTVEISRTQDFAATLDSRTMTDTVYHVAAGILFNNTRYYWRVSATDTGGTGPWTAPWSFTTSLTAVREVSGGTPSAFVLAQNFPNPFNPSTQIRFSVPVSSAVRLAVFDLQGREIALLVDAHLAPGTYSVSFDSRRTGLASGVYFYRISAAPEETEPGGVISGSRPAQPTGYTAVRKLVVVK
jgi:hypothetical protein